jgi:hypothetical protein
MVAMLLSVILSMFPMSQSSAGNPLPFEIRAKDSLIQGKGQTSGETYYDVVVTKQPADGVLVKLPYTQKGGKFSFDLHHRISLTPDFMDAEVTTIVEIITGGGTSAGVFNIVDKVPAGGKFDEAILKVSTAEVDRYVTPYSHKTITLNTIPGPQSLSIVGKSTIMKRGGTTRTIDTPGVRIAVISRMKFAEATTGTRLPVD